MEKKANKGFGMKSSPSLHLLDILRKQRECFIRLNDGQIHITNHMLYASYDKEALRLQEKIGRENKKIIIAECKERSLPIPNFRREAL